MERLQGDVQRVLAMEQTNSMAVNELRSAITGLRDVIGELGVNAATQAEALKGIKEVFTREFTSMRDEQSRMARDLQEDRKKLEDFNNHTSTKEELDRTKLDARFKEVDLQYEARFKDVEARTTTLETNSTSAKAYWAGAKFVLYFSLLGAGGLGMYVLEHVVPPLISALGQHVGQ